MSTSFAQREHFNLIRVFKTGRIHSTLELSGLVLLCSPFGCLWGKPWCYCETSLNAVVFRNI